jgi:tetratricopeptide (TPR) repeat protein
MKKHSLIDESISSAEPQYSLAVTIATAATAIVIAAYFTAQFSSYLPMPHGWENILAWLTPLYIVTQLLRVIGSTFIGVFGGRFWAVASAPLTEISILVACLLLFGRKKIRVGVFVMLFCLGFSIINFAYYTADTKTHAITVIGGMSTCAGGAHGWDYMIDALGLADYSFGIGKLLFFMGCWLMSFAPLAGLGTLVELLFHVGFFTKQTKREQFDGMINIARNQKIHKQFDEAIITLEKILEKDPDYPDVLFLKAQIYWEAREDSHTARKCLKRIIELVPDGNDRLHRWASSLLAELSDTDKAKAAGTDPE